MRVKRGKSCVCVISSKHTEIADYSVGSISAALSCLVYPPREERSAGSFPEQRLVIEPNYSDVTNQMNNP